MRPYDACAGLLFLSLLCLSIVDSQKLTASWMEERLFLRARCKAKCLRLFQNTTEQSAFKSIRRIFLQPSVQIDDCFDKDSERCSSNCFTACDQPPDQCRPSCSNQLIGCHIGCELLLDSVKLRPGECSGPNNQSIENSVSVQSGPLQSLAADNSTCFDLCHSDSDCANALHKCCFVGCKKSCVQPLFNASIPPLPAALKPTESKTAIVTTELDWSTPYSQLNPDDGPIVFILQTRICVCKQFDLLHTTDWQTLIMTHQFGAKLDAFEPGKMYQFHIAAVSPLGTRGFGPPSEPYPLSPVPPNPPSPPRNVTDSMWRFYSTGNINVLLSWEPPEHSDLPINEYSVKWVIDHGYVQPGGQSLEGLTQFTQSVASKKTHHIIQHLKPSTSYKVQVRAVSYWHGHGPMESQPNTVFLSTQSILPVFSPQTSVEQKLNGVILGANDQLHSNASNCECRSDATTKTTLTFKKVFYDNNELVAIFIFNPLVLGITYILEWAPQVCINPRESETVSVRQTLKVQGRTRIIYLNNLRFNCRYVIRLRQLSSDVLKKQTALSTLRTRRQDEVPTVYDCFCTPSCSEVEVNRGLPPTNCSLPDPGLPSPPLNLRVKNVSKFNYRISWRPPTVADLTTRTPIYSVGTQITDTKYRVVWAPRIDEPVSKEMYNDQAGFSPIMDLQKSDARIISKNQTWLDLHDLKEDTFYIVRVQTLIIMETEDHERESSPATLYFITPKMDETVGKSGKVELRSGTSDGAVVNFNCISANLLCSFLLTAFLWFSRT